jgi:hypothetical protein
MYRCITTAELPGPQTPGNQHDLIVPAALAKNRVVEQIPVSGQLQSFRSPEIPASA